METRSAKTEALAPLYFCEGQHIQILRWQFDGKLPTRECHAPSEGKNLCSLLRTPVCIDFKQKRESKNLCQQQTHLGRAIYAPKMEDACQKQNPCRSSSERREAGGSQGESLGAAMFASALCAVFAFSEQANLRFRLAEIYFHWFVLCRVAKNEHKPPAQRATKERSMSVWLRNNQKVLPHEPPATQKQKAEILHKSYRPFVQCYKLPLDNPKKYATIEL